MRPLTAMEKAASERGRYRRGDPALVDDFHQPSANWRPSRRARARIWDWLRSRGCASPRSPMSGSRRRGCGASLPRSVPSKTCASSHLLWVPSTGVSRRVAPSQAPRTMQRRRCSATCGGERHRRGTVSSWGLSSCPSSASGRLERRR